MLPVSKAFRVACIALAKKAESYGARVLRGYFAFFPADLDRQSYDDESFRAVLRTALAEQEAEYVKRVGYFPRLPDSAFVSPTVLGEYLGLYLLMHHDDLPEVKDLEVLQDPPLRSKLLMDLVEVYGLYKIRAYLKECFQQPYAQWKSAYDAEQAKYQVGGRKKSRDIGESAEQETDIDSSDLDGEPSSLLSRPLGSEEAATYLGVTLNSLYRLTHQRLIKHSKVGKKLYFTIQDLNDWAGQNKVLTIDEARTQAKKVLPMRKGK